MKKELKLMSAFAAVWAVAALAFLTATCSPNNKQAEADPTDVVETANTASDEAYCSQLKDWGLADAYIDRSNNALLIGVTAGQVTGDPDEVAKTYFNDAVGSGVRGLKECRIMQLPEGKMIGRYKR